MSEESLEAWLQRRGREKERKGDSRGRILWSKDSDSRSLESYRGRGWGEQDEMGGHSKVKVSPTRPEDLNSILRIT